MTEADTKPGLPVVDVTEYGGARGGVRQSMDTRLFMHLVVFDEPRVHGEGEGDLAGSLSDVLRDGGLASIVYADVVNPRGYGLLSWNQDPARLVGTVRRLFAAPPLGRVELRPGWAMLGRTYATGHESDLEYTLLRRPVDQVGNPAFPWHVWYPLRRTPAFSSLDPHEQAQVLREHAQIGMAYGASELAHDVRLACYGLDGADSEFVIGLCGKDLHPLSHLVQTMRRTRQTREYIARMGPFFVGQVILRMGA
ncbi:MAG: chlorite dismutase family protein [Polyangiaceae bacterium]|jgi:chlorite dismutase